MKKTLCKKCNLEVTNNNLVRHLASCKGPKAPPKVRGVDYDPNFGYKTGGRVAWNKGLAGDPRVIAASEKIAAALRGKTSKQNWTIESRRLQGIRQTRRLLDGYASGKRQQAGGFVKWIDVDGVKVQGTWEKRVAILLNTWKSLGKIRDWRHGVTRIPYSDENGKSRIYIVDFTVSRNDGTEYLIETKGRMGETDLHKWRAAEKLFYLEIWDLEKIKFHEHIADLAQR